MLGYQNPIKPRKSEDVPNLLIFKINCSNIEDIKYTFEITEYDKNLNDSYLIGFAGGSGSNYSLTLSPNWKKKEYTTSQDFEKAANSFWKKLTVIGNNDRLKSFFNNEGSWIKRILRDIENNTVSLFTQLDQFMTKYGFIDFKYPLVSKIKRKDKYEFLGDIFEMRKIYQTLFFPKLISSGEKKIFCRICGSENNLTEGFKLGMYSTTHNAFVMEFFSKFKHLHGQNIMCDECFLKTLHGFNFLREKLNFYAYSFKNSGTVDKVFHFIIPMITEETLLKKAIKLISKAKTQSDKAHNASIESQINSLNERLERIDRELKKSNEIKRKKLNKQQAETESKINERNKDLKKNNNSIDIDILINTLDSAGQNISILDFYYKITNVKQNPKIIEVISEILLNSDMIKKLSEIFKKTEKRFGRVALSDLHRLVEDRFFLEYYSSLLRLQSESKELFNKRCCNLLRKYFLTDFADIKYYDLNKKEKYYYLLDIYDRFIFMYDQENLWM